MIDFTTIIRNRISEVWFSDHEFDNTFVRCDLQKTIMLMEDRNLSPIGVCLEPNNCYYDGIALIYENQQRNTRWVHIPSAIVISWLNELNMLPPEDIVWDWKTIVKHVWLNNEDKGGIYYKS